MPDHASLPLPSGENPMPRGLKVAKAVCDATVVFCNRFLPGPSAAHDQMVKAAQANQGDDLAKAFKAFLIKNGLRAWPSDSKLALFIRERLKHDVVPNLPATKPGRVQLIGLAGLSEYVGKADAELAANAMLCATHQVTSLLRSAADPNRPTGPACPECGKPMRRKHTKSTGKPFWGCSKFPHCKGFIDGE